MKKFMPEYFVDRWSARELFEEQMHSPIMHGTRYSIPIYDTGKIAPGCVKDSDGGLIGKLFEKLFHYLRRHCA